MSATTPQPGDRAPAPAPPALPAALLKPWPVIVVIAAGWLVAVVLAFTVPGIARLAADLPWQDSASEYWGRRSSCGSVTPSRSGSRGAQTGLN